MRREKILRNLTGVCLMCLMIGILPGVASAQGTPERRTAIRARMAQLRDFSRRLTPKQRMMLSGAMLNAFELAEKWEDLEANLQKQPMSREEFSGKLSSAVAAESIAPGIVPVSNPAIDFLFSVLSGFTQSETSTAWCGSNVVVGFNDSGSIFESALFGPGGLSGSGAAFSNSQGASFQDVGFINPGSNPVNFLLGDPVLACQDASTFRYAQIFATGTMSAPLTAVALSTSNDGGATWGDPVAAVSKDAFTHALDKDWMTTDPTDSKRIFVTYTDFDVSGSVCGFSDGVPIQRVAIELVRSDDGGATWSHPVVIDEVCSTAPNFPFDQDSQVAVGPKGEVYVAWESLENFFFGRAIRIRKSHDHGATFGPSVKVDDVTCVGDCFALQGYFRSPFDLQGLAVDRSGSTTNGNVYVVWHDGRHLTVPDLEPLFIGSPNPVYGYADALLSRSTDGGASWSRAIRINNNPVALANGRGTDQFMPGIAVDHTGAIGACWYDRREDPLNFRIDRFCGVSTDGGQSFTNTRETKESFAPWHAVDGLINPNYMGDYDAVASDSTKSTSGFIGAFQIIRSGDGIFVPNPDVFAAEFK